MAKIGRNFAIWKISGPGQLFCLTDCEKSLPEGEKRNITVSCNMYFIQMKFYRMERIGVWEDAILSLVAFSYDWNLPIGLSARWI